MKKAVALISGGLDSMLAARLIQEQGIHVEGLNFYTGFCVEGHTQAIRNHEGKTRKPHSALWAAEQLGIKLHFIDIVEEYKQIVLNPKHGYGAHLNPCLDCKIFMVGQAKHWMEKHGFDFIITGEVIGQRPKSQLKKTMPIIAKASHAEDLLVRPLCAHLLEPTYPEQAGWLDREKLCGFSGRSRAPQMALAERFGFREYAQPAGGCCFLTNRHYTQKLQDLWTHRGERDYDFDDIILLKAGRHLRPAPHFKLIIGRDASENTFLERYQYQIPSLTPLSHSGSLTLIEGTLKKEELPWIGRIAARFTQATPEESVTFRVQLGPQQSMTLAAQPFTANEICKEWYIADNG